MNNLEDPSLRLFTGLSLTTPVLEFVTDIVELFSKQIDGVRWVPSKNLHVTLKFLGSCKISKIPELIKVMQKSCAFLPLKLLIGNVGGFPSHSSARVIWVGAEDIEGKLTDLYKTIERGAGSCGFPREKRRYQPHITIGRSKNGVKITNELLEVSKDKRILEVNEITLFQSILKKSGAEYSVIQKICTNNKS